MFSILTWDTFTFNAIQSYNVCVGKLGCRMGTVIEVYTLMDILNWDFGFFYLKCISTWVL